MEHCSKCGEQIVLEQDYYESSDGNFICINCHEKSDDICYCAKCRLIAYQPRVYNDKSYHQWCFEVLIEGKQLVLEFPTEELSLNLNFGEV